MSRTDAVMSVKFTKESKQSRNQFFSVVFWSATIEISLVDPLFDRRKLLLADNERSLVVTTQWRHFLWIESTLTFRYFRLRDVVFEFRSPIFSWSFHVIDAVCELPLTLIQYKEINLNNSKFLNRRF